MRESGFPWATKTFVWGAFFSRPLGGGSAFVRFAGPVDRTARGATAFALRYGLFNPDASLFCQDVARNCCR